MKYCEKKNLSSDTTPPMTLGTGSAEALEWEKGAEEREEQEEEKKEK